MVSIYIKALRNVVLLCIQIKITSQEKFNFYHEKRLDKNNETVSTEKPLRLQATANVNK